jgi:hypothetical protein
MNCFKTANNTLQFFKRNPKFHRFKVYQQKSTFSQHNLKIKYPFPDTHATV